MAGKDGKTTIVIRKIEEGGGGHHGGAWKVAYADFVTAMMAFFLLMWLLNATTEQQKRGIADYFNPSPANASANSGSGMIFGGRTPNSDGSYVSDRGAPPVSPSVAPLTTLDDDTQEDIGPADTETRRTLGAGLNRGAEEWRAGKASSAQRNTSGVGWTAGGAEPAPGLREGEGRRSPTDKDLQAELDRREKVAFEAAAQQIRDAMRADPALADLAKQLVVDITPEGLRVQLIDEERQPMFALGSSSLNERARAVIAKIAPVLMRLPQSISLAGHTDSAPYKGSDRSNWDLSAERANATRRLLLEAGLPESRIRSVAGMADRDPLVPNDRLSASNRRIAITVLRDTPSGAIPAGSTR